MVLLGRGSIVVRVALLGNADSIHVRRWASEMEARGIDMLLLSRVRPDWAREWAYLDTDASRVRGLGLGTRALGRQIATACRAHAVDVLHVHYLGGLARAAAVSGIHPFVLTVWGSDLLAPSSRSLRRRLWANRVLRTADMVTCGSRNLVDAAVGAGAHPESCVEIGWGVETDRYAPDRLLRDAERSRLGLRPETIMFLSNRHLEPLYRVASVVEALAQMPEDGPPTKLAIVGAGSEAERINEIVRSHQLGDRVFMLGRLPGDDDMVAVLAAADVYVTVPVTDGGPISVLEAMAAALPVVASDVPANREWVKPQINGALWDGCGPRSLAGAMAAVLSERVELGRRGRLEVIERAERSLLMDAMANHYERLVRAPSATA